LTIPSAKIETRYPPRLERRNKLNRLDGIKSLMET
jgi:hypothetical protein